MYTAGGLYSASVATGISSSACFGDELAYSREMSPFTARTACGERGERREGAAGDTVR